MLYIIEHSIVLIAEMMLIHSVTLTKAISNEGD